METLGGLGGIYNSLSTGIHQNKRRNAMIYITQPRSLPAREGGLFAFLAGFPKGEPDPSRPQLCAFALRPQVPVIKTMTWQQ